MYIDIEGRNRMQLSPSPDWSEFVAEETSIASMTHVQMHTEICCVRLLSSSRM